MSKKKLDELMDDLSEVQGRISGLHQIDESEERYRSIEAAYKAMDAAMRAIDGLDDPD